MEGFCARGSRGRDGGTRLKKPNAAMSRVAYINGRYLPQREACVNVEDRGYQFADGVYEVVYVHGGRLIDTGLHLDRLDRSLREIRIAPPIGRAALVAVLDEVLRR